MGGTSSSEPAMSVPETIGTCLSTTEPRPRSQSRILSSKTTSSITRIVGSVPQSQEAISVLVPQCSVPQSLAAPKQEPLQTTHLAGAPLTLLEARFDPKSSSCQACGNTGLSRAGNFCKCPYGRKNPPARLHEGQVQVDVGFLPTGSDGEAMMPRLKLGIRGPYVYQVGGLSSVAKPTWTDTYASWAAMGPTFPKIIEIVQDKAGCSSTSCLLDSMPQILNALRCSLNIDLDEEARQAAKAVRGDDHLQAHGIVYAFSKDITSVKFMDALDIAGYNTFICEDFELNALGLDVRASLSHNRRVVRLSVFQQSSRTGFDGIVQLKRSVPEHREALQSKRRRQVKL